MAMGVCLVACRLASFIKPHHVNDHEEQGGGQHWPSPLPNSITHINRQTAMTTIAPARMPINECSKYLNASHTGQYNKAAVMYLMLQPLP